MFARLRLSAGSSTQWGRWAAVGSSAVLLSERFQEHTVHCAVPDPAAPPWHLGNVQEKCNGHDSVASALSKAGLNTPSALAAVDGGGLCALPLDPDALQFLEDIVITEDAAYAPILGSIRTDITVFVRAMLAHLPAYEQAMVPPPTPAVSAAGPQPPVAADPPASKSARDNALATKV